MPDAGFPNRGKLNWALTSKGKKKIPTETRVKIGPKWNLPLILFTLHLPGKLIEAG
jgi:hypothetical protein